MCSYIFEHVFDNVVLVPGAASVCTRSEHVSNKLLQAIDDHTCKTIIGGLSRKYLYFFSNIKADKNL